MIAFIERLCAWICVACLLFQNNILNDRTKNLAEIAELDSNIDKIDSIRLEILECKAGVEFPRDAQLSKTWKAENGR